MTLSSMRRALLVLAAASAASAVRAADRAPAGEPIRIALVEGLSGPFANAGEAVLRTLRFAVARVNARGGVRVGDVRRPLELLELDGKGGAEESVAMLRQAIDRGAVAIVQGNSSTVAAALSEAVSRHNERDPAHRVLFLNYSAVDPTLTESRCSFWHFRFDAHADMRMAALVEAIAGEPSIRRVYLLNQDYAFGRQVAASARRLLAQRRPDVEVVADELHPLGRVRDFAPYAARIAAARADAVVTGNWGNDLALLVRAARDAGLDLSWYTFYGNSLGAPAAIGEAGVGRVRAVAEWHPDAGIAAGDAIWNAFRATLASPRDDWFAMRQVIMVDMLAAAIEAAGSTEAGAVARALEGREHAGPPYPVTLRAADHQLLTPQYVVLMQRAGEGARHAVEGSPYGFRTERRVDARTAAPRVACTMDRPR
jgi:branched-chain amino acid transport system substrate-binding protein